MIPGAGPSLIARMRGLLAQSRGAVWLVAGALFLALVMFDYQPLALALLIVAGFVVSVAARLFVWMDENRFTPRGPRIGISWALLGIDPETDEYDPSPVIIYFVLLAMLFTGLLLRPILQGMFG